MTLTLEKIMEKIINQDNTDQKKPDEIGLITKIEAVLYLKGRPVAKKNLSESFNKILENENFAMIMENNTFIGLLTKVDLLAYLKKDI